MINKGQDMKRPDKIIWEHSKSHDYDRGWTACHKAHDPIIAYQDQRIKELEDSVDELWYMLKKAAGLPLMEEAQTLYTLDLIENILKKHQKKDELPKQLLSKHKGV